jgi:hemerythrin
MGIQFIWSDDYTVGEEDLDNDHKQLFDLGNRIQAAKPSEARGYVMAMYKYASSHFTREEKHMKSIGFPETKEHTDKHEALITKLNDLSKDFTPDKIEELVTFLHNWLVNHVLFDDKKYFDFNRKKK